MTRFDRMHAQFAGAPARWLVTGAAGFIGSHLSATLLQLGQEVVAIDNFETGDPERVARLARIAGAGNGSFEFHEGDIRDTALMGYLCRGAEYVLHQAALVSVHESLSNPQLYHDVNVTGFLNVCVAAAQAGVRRVVYASSCAVYGDSEEVTKSETMRPAPISPYALTKEMDELYGALLLRTHGLHAVGLRYFNVFGPGQLTGGQYGAVIPRWIDCLLGSQPGAIYGDGLTTRDFCWVGDVVQANLLAAKAHLPTRASAVFNVGSGEQITLRDLYSILRAELGGIFPGRLAPSPVYAPHRPGDIRHIRADISLARAELGFAPAVTLTEGLRATLRWRVESLEEACAGAVAALAEPSPLTPQPH